MDFGIARRAYSVETRLGENHGIGWRTKGEAASAGVEGRCSQKDSGRTTAMRERREGGGSVRKSGGAPI